MPTLHVQIVPAFKDNYIHLLHDPESGATAIVDPGEAAPVVPALERLGWRPSLILNTHHHADHVGGNLALKTRFGLEVVGPGAEAARIPGLDRAVGEGDEVAVGRTVARVLDVPGHTAGHVAYWFGSAAIVLTGDTLFAAGCGRLFEGTPGQMWTSLSKLAGLPSGTRVYCAHEYTADNIRFALSVDPANEDLRRRAAAVAQARARGLPTVPSTIAEEQATNPFLRAADAQDFARLRLAKDSFR